MRLRDLWADPPGLLTHREVINLVSYLPPEAATMRLVFGADAPWTPEMHRLTDIADALDRANWQRQAKPGSRPPPTRFRRPKPPPADNPADEAEEPGEEPSADAAEVGEVGEVGDETDGPAQDDA